MAFRLRGRGGQSFARAVEVEGLLFEPIIQFMCQSALCSGDCLTFSRNAMTQHSGQTQPLL